MFKRTATLLLVASVTLVAFLGMTSVALSASDYDKGYDEGKTAALERLKEGEKASWFSADSFTGPVGVLISYVRKPEARALRCLGECDSDQYRQGFVCGFCETVNQKQRACFKAIKDCRRINVLGRLP